MRHKCSKQVLGTLCLFLAAVTDLIEAEPAELKRRGNSLSAVEVVAVAAGSWTMGKMHSNRSAWVPESQRPERVFDNGSHHGLGRVGDHGHRSGPSSVDGSRRRRNSLSVVGHDSEYLRSSLHAFAGTLSFPSFTNTWWVRKKRINAIPKNTSAALM